MTRRIPLHADAVLPPLLGTTTPSDPAGHYLLGRQLLALIDHLGNANSSGEAAALLDHVLEPTDGLLARVAEFFEATGEKAKESDHDDGFDLCADFEDAALDIRDCLGNLSDAVERMHALGHGLQPAARIPPASVPAPPPPASGRPNRSR
ncbi:hypothetical protein ACQPZG_31750 [Streptomyces sp. CA-294286]|uniref:hypothetical protein n=1 Tax=Streptomyces sp. CA-294286 TaxID=3240070 RepID=UPI003D900F22